MFIKQTILGCKKLFYLLFLKYVNISSVAYSTAGRVAALPSERTPDCQSVTNLCRELGSEEK